MKPKIDRAILNEFDHDPRVLIVDDDAEIAGVIHEIVRNIGVACDVESDPQSALTQLRSRPVDVVLCDIAMPTLTGIDVLRRTRALGLDMPFVFLTGFGSPEKIIDAVRLGAFDFLLKPSSPAEIASALERALGYASRMQRLQVLLRDLEVVAPQTQALLEDLRRQCAMLRVQAVRAAC